MTAAPADTVARSGRRARWTPLISVLVLLLLGVLSGVLWAYLTPTAEVTVTDRGMAIPPEESAHLFGGPATFALTALVLGLVCGLTVWFAAPGVRGPIGVGYGVLVALVASGIGLEVGEAVAGRLYPGVDPQQAGTYRVVESLWLSDTGWRSIEMPWLLLICAPGTAALAFLICAAGAGDRAWTRGRPETVEPADGFEQAGDVEQPGDVEQVTGADGAWRTRR
ncbi:DUF2567 domain-containing protein [Gordonia caeni]|uniref:DUF2567 domain-containing protein n=1 Tax=Gordonia caeni TaxID=1007097 RepID=A0ABP7PE85_9ACTN